MKTVIYLTLLSLAWFVAQPFIMAYNRRVMSIPDYLARTRVVYRKNIKPDNRNYIALTQDIENKKLVSNLIASDPLSQYYILGRFCRLALILALCYGFISAVITLIYSLRSNLSWLEIIAAEDSAFNAYSSAISYFCGPGLIVSLGLLRRKFNGKKLLDNFLPIIFLLLILIDLFYF